MPAVNPDSKPTDNPIAVAGLVVAVLALILSIIVVGGVIGIVSFIMCVVGLRRSKSLGRGRGMAITGIILSILSILAAAAALAILIVTLSGGEETIRNGIATTSENTEFPPQDDLTSLDCSASESGDVPLAIITLDNHSTGRSIYSVTVEWETPRGDMVEAEVTSDFVDAGESETLRLFERSGEGLVDSCRVTKIDRSGFFFFN